MRHRLFIAPLLALALSSSGCDPLQVEADRPAPAGRDSGMADDARLACDDAADCQGCLALGDCNWTGGLCADTCLMDTYCYGPGNPAAPSCPEPAACADLTDCQGCLALDGCNWTGGLCDESCLMDTYCYGPGNPAAPSCPEPAACADLTDEQQCADRADCQRQQGTCLFYCLPEEVGCCEFLGCQDKEPDPSV